MISENKTLFEDFKKVHDEYCIDPKKNSAKFNEAGQRIVEIIRDWENRLCNQMESGNKAVYSINLADKFMAEVKKYLPQIDMVGVKIVFK